MDYTSLVATVASRLNRTDLTSLIPDFIARAEDEIFARIAASPVRPMQTTATGTAYTSSFSVPTGFIDAISLSVTSGSESWPLVRLGPADDPDYYGTRALPYRTECDGSKIRHYTVVGSTIYLSDTPSSALAYTLRCFTRPANLSSGVPTNWIIDSHADVYEFGTLMHAARHIRDNQLKADMRQDFADALQLMLDAYPETQQPSELRAADAPWAAQAGWNINNG